VLEAEVPGVRMEDLEITCIDRTLTIRGERPDPEGSDGSYERRERPVGTFLRSVELPEEVDAAKTEAVLEEGILRIRIPKAERAGPRRIEIRSPARAAATPAKAEEPAAKKEEK
jgi:HSP20 family protein